MKRIIFYVLVFCSAIAIGQNEELFEKANQAYANGDYQDAIEAYTKVLDEGKVSVALYFNLANAHYKLNHIAPSIYYYEKALQLEPNDGDVRNNIQFARNMAMDDIQAVEETGIEKRFNNVIATFSFDAWAKFAIGFSVLFGMVFLGYYYSHSSLIKRILFAGALVFLVCAITSVYFAYHQQDVQRNANYAIVFSEEAPIRSEPNLRGEPAFILHEGTKTKILENYQQWYKIVIADGKQGWVKKENVRKL